MKNKFFTVVILALSIFLTGCTNGTRSNGEKIVLRFAYASNSQPVIDSMKEFGRLVEEKTNGEVTVSYYPDSQLGGEVELIELTQTGAIDFTKVSASALEGFSKDYSIFSIPYLFDDENHFFAVMENEDIMNEIYLSTKDLGFKGITYYDSGQRSFYMKNGPINGVEDLKGKKIRVMQSETAIKMIKLLGGSPVPMGSGEVFTSLQAGLIDGSENNEFVLFTAGHGAVAKYYSYDEHTRIPDIIIMSNSVERRLSNDQLKAVQEAAYESTEFEKEIFKKAVEDEKNAAIEKYNIIYNKVDNKEFQKAVQPLHDEFKNSEEYAELYLKIRSLAK